MKTELEGRTKDFAVQIIFLTRSFPKSVDGIEVGRQLLRAASSIGANYREANRAESRRDFIHKVGIAEKEAAETGYWLELCTGASIGAKDQVATLLKESCELLAILTTIGRKAKQHRLIKTSALSIFVIALAGFAIFAF